jgi:pyridoxal phosphate enzyme (YggS family)
MSVKENILEFKELLKDKNCQLIAVSKTKPVEMIQEAYDAGQLDFGENKVQELRDKPGQLPADIRWHMIGHLQTNKVKYIAPFIHLIHAVDSLKLLQEINKQALKNERTINCLLQIHIAKEEHKFGMSQDELIDLISDEKFRSLSNIRVVGLMGMATFTDDEDQIRSEFNSLKHIFDFTKENHHSPNVALKEISMGMSDDYAIAMEEGSTMIRVGSKIFGPRIYLNK